VIRKGSQLLVPKSTYRADVKRRIMDYFDSLDNDEQDRIAERSRELCEAGLDAYSATLVAMTESAERMGHGGN